MLNHVEIQGRLTRDIELDTSNQTSIGRFTLASDRSFKNKNGDRDTDFIRCVAFGKTAENLANFFKKGDMALLQGRWQTGSYQGKDGNTVYTNDLAVDQFDFCGSGKKSQSPTSNTSQYNPQPQQQQGEMALDDVPFDHDKSDLGDVAF